MMSKRETRRMIQALECAIEWNDSLIDAHRNRYPKLYRGKSLRGYAANVREWRAQIKAWGKLIRKLRERVSERE